MTRMFLNITRTLPSLIWAFLFVIFFGGASDCYLHKTQVRFLIIVGAPIQCVQIVFSTVLKRFQHYFHVFSMASDLFLIVLHFVYFFPCGWKPHNVKNIIGCLNFYFWRCSECRQSIVKLFFTFLTPCWVMCIGHDAFFKRSLTDTLCIPMNDLALKNLFFFILSLFFDKPSPSLYVALCVQCWQFCKVSNKRCWRLWIRYFLRFFDQTTYASMGNKHFITK